MVHIGCKIPPMDGYVAVCPMCDNRCLSHISRVFVIVTVPKQLGN